MPPLPVSIALKFTSWLVMVAIASIPTCFADQSGEERVTTGGDRRRAPALMREYGCVTCHTIPGVQGANGLVGPSLSGFASRSYIGGVLPNTPPNLIRWIQDPQKVDSLTAMPSTGVTEADARDIAAYLYTLRVR